ncbi:MAG: hypothetical protein JO341_09490 [Gammaproteobacteria bacterium]|nr:hypothetical protein [Gammaproteobacteria bacterium]MBV9621241.1 hypothetical protein [Gammaproteobacteria bacterium]
MTALYLDANLTDDERRHRLYQGDLFVYAPSPESLELVAFAREMLRQAFAPHDPELAQYSMPVADFAALLGELKPKFIHHPECKRLLPALLQRLGCDPHKTYFDVPRLRSATSDEYLTTGIAYAFHPHRDTWYSAPFCQINCWLPITALSPDNCMAFHSRYFAQPVRNSSEIYNYQEWNRTSRFNAAQQINADTRPQPKALEPVELQPDVRVLPPPGGILLFSAAQLHSTVPNTSRRTRFSIDFRIVNLDDATALRGARNVDSRCTGSTMGDYLRCTDLAHLPSAATAPYEAGPPQAATG